MTNYVEYWFNYGMRYTTSYFDIGHQWGCNISPIGKSGPDRSYRTKINTPGHVSVKEEAEANRVLKEWFRRQNNG